LITACNTGLQAATAVVEYFFTIRRTFLYNKKPFCTIIMKKNKGPQTSSCLFSQLTIRSSAHTSFGYKRKHVEMFPGAIHTHTLERH